MLAIGKTEVSPGVLAPAASPPRTKKKSTKRSKPSPAAKKSPTPRKVGEPGPSTEGGDVEMMDCGEAGGSGSSSCTASVETKRAATTSRSKCNGASVTNGKRCPGLRPPPFLTIEGLNKTLAFGRELKSMSMRYAQHVF
jgi:hypothetical protein